MTSERLVRNVIQTLIALTIVSIVWMLWNVYPSIPQRMLQVGCHGLWVGVVLVKPENIRVLLGKVVLGLAVLALAVGGLLQFAIPYAVHRVSAEVQQVQVDTAERVKETLTPSWFERLTSR